MGFLSTKGGVFYFPVLFCNGGTYDNIARSGKWSNYGRTPFSVNQQNKNVFISESRHTLFQNPNSKTQTHPPHHATLRDREREREILIFTSQFQWYSISSHRNPINAVCESRSGIESEREGNHHGCDSVAEEATRPRSCYVSTGSLPSLHSFFSHVL